MSGYEVVDASAAHVEPIARAIRQADIDEIWAAAALLPRDALARSLALAVHSGTWLVDGEPAAIGGIRHDGVVWLVTTDLIERHQRAFLEESRRQLDAVKQYFDSLYNFVDVRNRRAIRWLKWLGFSMCEPIPFGVFRKPFLPFFWRAN